MESTGWGREILGEVVDYGRWAASLPSRDMLEMAVPEGVLQQNGRLSGLHAANGCGGSDAAAAAGRLQSPVSNWDSHALTVSWFLVSPEER